MTLRPLFALLASLAVLAAPAVQAQTYPNKPIRLVIPFPPAGATDIIGRVVAQKLGDALGQSIVVDNKPGAGGAIGTDIAAKSAPDGYTILIATTSTHSVGPALSTKLPYDTVKDFTPIIHLADSPHVLVVSSMTPYKTVNELIAAAKAKPGSLNYGSSGVGTIVQLTAEEFKLATKTDIVHVPYKGTALAFGDLATGQVTMMFDNVISAQPSLQSGKVRPLGVTSAKRSALMPNVPTMVEAGVPGFVSEAYFGLWGPANLPAAIVAKVNADANKILQAADLKERFAQLGCVPVGGTPQAFAQHINSETAKWSGVIKAAGIKPE
ncbi:MAG TPA: tripartite tricarboxylate transporter substrate binding protein [Burkholderiales bacterium]|nr:tripartite tricarboxylate transporter substrate binding protein [Burkholderiales bacterium]